jgi:hypothetical protein
VHQVSSPNGCVVIVIREKGTVPVRAAEQADAINADATS